MSNADQSPRLSLPYIQAAQAQKHVTHNEAVERLDLLVQLTVEAVDATTPPASAADGQAWIIGAAPTGVWSSNAGGVAAWQGGGWVFVTPQTGWRAWDKTNAVVVAYDGTVWAQTGGAPDLDNLDGVGVNTASDATNRLAVASPATLLTHEGAGHQLKINKAGPTDTASLLYQTNWSGRAEMGLAGNDDFAIKVSADGATFTDALRVDAATGAVAMPATGTRQLMPFNYRYYLYTDKRWVSHSANAASLNASVSHGIGAEPNLSWATKGIFLPAGSVINQFLLAGNISNNEVTDMDLRFYFQHGPWNNSWNTADETTRETLFSGDGVGIVGNSGMRNMEFSIDYVTPAAGYFAIAARAEASSTLAATRYFYSAGALDVTLPPSV